MCLAEKDIILVLVIVPMPLFSNPLVSAYYYILLICMHRAEKDNIFIHTYASSAIHRCTALSPKDDATSTLLRHIRSGKPATLGTQFTCFTRVLGGGKYKY